MKKSRNRKDFSKGKSHGSKLWNWFKKLSLKEKESVLSFEDEDCVKILRRMYQTKEKIGGELLFYSVGESIDEKLFEKLKLTKPIDNFCYMKLSSINHTLFYPERLLEADNILEDSIRLADTRKYLDTMTVTSTILEDGEKFLKLLLVASRGGFLSQPCRVHYDSHSKKWIWDVPKWFEGMGYYTLGTWIAHKLEKALWLRYWDFHGLNPCDILNPIYRFPNSLEGLLSKSYLVDFWKQRNTQERRKIVGSIGNIVRHVLTNTDEKDKKTGKIAQSLDYTELLARLVDLSTEEKKIELLFSDSDLAQNEKTFIELLYFSPLHRAGHPVDMILRRIGMSIQCAYTEKISMDLIVGEEAEKIKKHQQGKKKRSKKEKVKMNQKKKENSEKYQKEKEHLKKQKEIQKGVQSLVDDILSQVEAIIQKRSKPSKSKKKRKDKKRLSFEKQLIIKDEIKQSTTIKEDSQQKSKLDSSQRSKSDTFPHKFTDSFNQKPELDSLEQKSKFEKPKPDLQQRPKTQALKADLQNENSNNKNQDKVLQVPIEESKSQNVRRRSWSHSIFLNDSQENEQKNSSFKSDSGNALQLSSMGIENSVPPLQQQNFESQIVPSTILKGAKQFELQKFAIRLHQEIEDYVKDIKFKVKTKYSPLAEAMIDKIQQVAENLWPSACIKVYGSYATSLCIPSSDLDLVIIGNTSARAVQAVGILTQALRKKPWLRSLQPIETAKVPIIKLTSHSEKIPTDISFANQSEILISPKTAYASDDLVQHSGIAASALVKNFLGVPGFKPLVLVLKQFLYNQGLNNVYTGGLSSYCLVLMVISFLQLFENCAGPSHKNLGTLLILFLEYYGKRFDFGTTGISINNRGNPHFKLKDTIFQYAPAPLVIVDPFNPMRNIGQNTFGMWQVKAAFGQLHTLLCSLQQSCPENLLSFVVS